MTNKVLAAVALVSLGLTAGCGSSSPATSTTAISGKVADGYLSNAIVFMDRNHNYQLDAGEPSAVTDQKGDFTLLVNPMDVGTHPIVAMAIGGQTTDLDNPMQKVAMSYVMSLPASAVSATATSFVSPISTLVREKMEARAGMTLSEAMTEVRNQMNLPPGMNVMADYVRLGSADSSDPNQALYSMMHGAAQNMASLMVGEASKVMGMAGTGSTVDVNRFRAMMGAMNLQLPQMISAMQSGVRQNPALMSQIMANVANAVSAVPPMVAGMPFRNMSSLFPPMMHTRFWNMTGGNWTTRNTWGPFWNMTTHYNFGSIMPRPIPIGSTSTTGPFYNITTHYNFGSIMPRPIPMPGTSTMGSATGMGPQMMTN
jgi:hypothetical protein